MKAGSEGSRGMRLAARNTVLSSRMPLICSFPFPDGVSIVDMICSWRRIGGGDLGDVVGAARLAQLEVLAAWHATYLETER